MKKIFALILVLTSFICANAQQWYYVDTETDPYTGTSPRVDNRHYVAVLVKDNAGDLWIYHNYGFGGHDDDDVRIMKTKIMKNRDYFVNAFNKGEYDGKKLWYQDNSLKGIGGLYSDGAATFYYKLKLVQQLTKCNIYDCDGLEFAIGLDYKTIIRDPNSSNPIYLKCYPIETFITHRNADDLF